MANERILVIDDSSAVLAQIKGRLTEEGFDVITTTETVGTARYLRECMLVIIDYHMPGINGEAVLESLRTAAENSGADPKFYLYTSDGSLAGGYRQLGFDGSFTNKRDVEVLARQVNSLFRLLRLRAMRKK